MKKDIFKSFMAIGFIVIALMSGAYLNELKANVKEEVKKEKAKKLIMHYDSEDINKEFNLPLVIIDTNGNILNRKEKVVSNIQVYDDKDGTNKLSNDPTISSKAAIKIRGNSTSKYPKKQYSIELTNNKGKEKKESLLNMPKSSDWVLNGPFADKSLIRNYIALNTSSKIMEYAPRAKFCEVFVVDDNSTILDESHYRGVYLMIEKIKRDDERLNITKSIDNIDETSFILSKDRKRQDDIELTTYGKETDIYSNGLNVIYPKNSLTKEKYEYMEKYISEFERILYSDKFNDPIIGYSKYIDVDSFVDYYVINEFFKNTDAGLYSTYMYKDYEEKIKAGPVWDFNKSLGNHNYEIGIPFDYTSFFMNQRPWFDRLMEDVNFANKVVSRYKDLRKSYLSDEYLIESIDDAVNLLGESINRNFHKWPIELLNQAELFEENQEISGKHSSDIKIFEKYLEENKHLIKSVSGKSKSHEEEIKLMKNFIIQRGKWMDENIDSLSKWAN